MASKSTGELFQKGRADFGLFSRIETGMSGFRPTITAWFEFRETANLEGGARALVLTVARRAVSCRIRKEIFGQARVAADCCALNQRDSILSDPLKVFLK